MTVLMHIRDPEKIEEQHSSLNDHIVIVIYYTAVITGHYRIKALALMHAECKRTVLHIIPEGVFHLILISLMDRAFQYTFPYRIFIKDRCQRVEELSLLLCKLCFVGQSVIKTAAAYTAVAAPYLRKHIAFVMESHTYIMRTRDQ